LRPLLILQSAVKDVTLTKKQRGWKALLYQCLFNLHHLYYGECLNMEEARVATPLYSAFPSKIVLNSKLVAQQSYDNMSNNHIN